MIRHGQTEWNAIGRWQGQADPPLNENGRVQAQQAAIALKSQMLTALISSDLLRTQQTAEIIATTLRLKVALEPRLREVNLGQWQGLYSDEIRARWPNRMRKWLETPLATSPPDGESIRELSTRVVNAVNEIATRYSKQRIGIVAHELPIAIIVTQSAGIPLEKLREHIPPNAAWQEIEWLSYKI